MAYSQGVCSNCGSLIQLNPAQETARCIFCWGQTATAQALSLAEDRSSHVFANAEITDAPPFEERLNRWRLEVGDNSPAKNVLKQKTNHEQKSATKVQEVKKDALSAVERIKRMKFDLLKVPNVSLRNRILLALGLVVLPIAAVAALWVPSYFARESKVQQLQAKLGEIVNSEYLSPEYGANAVAFSNYGADELRVVLAQEPDTAALEAMGQAYYKLYNEITAGAAKQGVTVQVLHKSGSYNVKVDEAAKVSIEELERTK